MGTKGNHMEHSHERAVFADSLSQPAQKKSYVAPTGPQVLSLRETEKAGMGGDLFSSSS
jgi:hypothetical protein